MFLHQINLKLCITTQVTILDVSNNWHLSCKDSETILLEWLAKYNTAKQFSKEYLIRGNKADNTAVICVNRTQINLKTK